MEPVERVYNCVDPVVLDPIVDAVVLDPIMLDPVTELAEELS